MPDFSGPRRAPARWHRFCNPKDDMRAEADPAEMPRHLVRCSIEIDAEPDRIFDLWLQLEDLSQIMDGVRRVKCVNDRCVLWEADIAGRQLVWEAEVLESQRPKRIAWASRSGTPNRGEVLFERASSGRTRIDVRIECQPNGLLERLGARLGLPRRQVESDLLRFRRFVEALPPEHDTPRVL